tara:strand:+ start:1752 stop:2021 length:270 start_codon:yes stop_codon:yes gene_type:complete
VPILNGDDITRINEFAEDHGKEWQILDNFNGGIRLKFKDNKAFVYHKNMEGFEGVGRWPWEDKEEVNEEPTPEVESEIELDEEDTEESE